MKLTLQRTIAMAFLMSIFHVSLFAEKVKVNTLATLMEVLDKDDANVTLAPGTYTITKADAEAGLYGITDFEDRAKILLLFSGNNCVYDFTGVTIQIETGVFQSYNNYRVHELVVTGNNNVLKNLTMVDLGSVYDKPNKGALGVCMDGKDNRIEGFSISTKGSFPYGYGDAFGKGKHNVIRHYKHSAFLIRGLRNHAKNCHITHRSYGHAMFMQAASYPTIEGCIIEGEVRKTDDMLSETSGPAFDVDFMTVWGYKLPKGYMLSTGEAGIRAYNGGTTLIDGKIIRRGTDNPTILNCTIKHMRTGVTLAHATGKKYVKGCVATECENGYSLGSGQVVDCAADCVYGPVYASTYETDKGFNADITILAAKVPYCNGSGNVAYIGGSKHKINFKGSSDFTKENLSIMVGGEKGNIRLLNGNLPNQNNFAGSNFELNNSTNIPVRLSNKSADVVVKTTAQVFDEGENNQVKK